MLDNSLKAILNKSYTIYFGILLLVFIALIVVVNIYHINIFQYITPQIGCTVIVLIMILVLLNIGRILDKKANEGIQEVSTEKVRKSI